MKHFYVGVKAVIRTSNGVLVLRHDSGYWDMPGGRIDDGESLEDALRREICEELPGTIVESIGPVVGGYRLDKDIEPDVGLILVYFDVSVRLPENIILSEEHEAFHWIPDAQRIPEEMYPNMKDIVKRALAEKLLH